LSRIAAQGLPVPLGVAVKNLSQPSAVPEEEDLEVPSVLDQGTLKLQSCKKSRQARQASSALRPLRLAGLTEW
jgi:hypothetical protein